jgi:hypothetical protein
MTNSDPNAHVKIGTLTDFEGTEVTVRRDYTTLELPSVQIERDQFPALRKILDDAEAAIIACEQEMAEDGDGGDEDGETPRDSLVEWYEARGHLPSEARDAAAFQRVGYDETPAFLRGNPGHCGTRTGSSRGASGCWRADR